MKWYNPRTWFSQSDEQTDSRPPKPDDKTKVERKEFDVYEATVEYRNGDTETIRCYGKNKSGDMVKFRTDVSWYETHTSGRHIRTRYSRRAENYETLNREPKMELAGTEVYRIQYEVYHEWSDNDCLHKDMKWRERLKEDSLEVNKID
jgi:hypothetical protein